MEEIIEKLRSCLPYSARPLAEERVEAAIARLEDFENEENIADLMRLFTAQEKGEKE